MNVSLVCVAKNETPYLEEWVDYNFKLGFDKIIVYQNDWRTDLVRDNLIKYELDGLNKQRDSYRHHVMNNQGENNWTAFFDVDEYLVLKKHNNIKDFVSDYSDSYGIGVNWVLFGDNGYERVIDNEYSLLKRFTKRQDGINPHVKSIVKITNGLIMDIHNPNHYIMDTNYNKFIGPFNPKGDDNIAQLNHYFCKTKEEFQQKCDRGRADTDQPIYYRKMKDFDEYNKNEIIDLTAHNFYFNK